MNFLNCLEINKVRNINYLNLELNPKFNLISGDNGSGKTSILESIYLLSLGRSFRHRSAQSVIQYGAEELTVFGILKQKKTKVSLGIQRTQQGKFAGKIQGEPIKSTAQLAELLPLQLVEPNSYELLTDGPKLRRQFIDWGLFHVKHGFFNSWRRWQRLLDQRNSALKQQLSQKEITSWDEEWIVLSEEITEMRLNHVSELEALFVDVLQTFNADLKITMRYKKGWKQDENLLTAIERNFYQDKQLGYTQVGPQRADLVLTVENHSVQDVLSRGQQKLLVYALHLAQGLLLQKQLEKNCIYLLDDLTAELDEHHCHQVIQVLLDLQAQVIITGVDCEKLKSCLPEKDTQTFHVKHGELYLR